MERPRVQPYLATDPPGKIIQALRSAKGWSQTELGQRCTPPLDFSTISRLERNVGYSKGSLEAVAAALGVNVATLFTDPRLAPMWQISESRRERIYAAIADAAALEKAGAHQG